MGSGRPTKYSEGTAMHVTKEMMEDWPKYMDEARRLTANDACDIGTPELRAKYRANLMAIEAWRKANKDAQ